MSDARLNHSAPLIHAYLDGELDTAETLAVEQRMIAEPALAAERERLETLRRVLQENLPRETVPPDLRRRIERSIGLQAASSRPSWRALAASVAFVAVLASGTTWAVLQPQRSGDIADAIVSGHVRALMAPQSSDVLSSDRHTVKPWFNGRIPQAPRVVDLSSQDFKLVGGRLDVVERVPVASLLYQRRQHLISLTAIPKTSAVSAPTRRTVDGYNIVAWNDTDVSYWATSDLNQKELDEFAAAFRAAP
jgi:anti-sigma factor RsiW